MGLYLTVFDADEEVEGVEVGSYSDFALFRDTVTERLEGGKTGTRFPTLLLHSDCDGSWSPAEAALLQSELEEIAVEFRRLPPLEPGPDTWQSGVVKSLGLRPSSLWESFFDIDGEPLIGRLLQLAGVSQSHKLDIIFQ